MLVLLIPRRSPEIAALPQYVGRKAQRGTQSGSISEARARKPRAGAPRPAAHSQMRCGIFSTRSSASTATLGVSYRSRPRSACGCHWTWQEWSSIVYGRRPRNCASASFARVRLSMSLSWPRPSFTRYICGQRSSATMPAGMLVTEVVAAETVAAVAAVVAPPPCGARRDAVLDMCLTHLPCPPAELQLCWGFPFSGQRFVGEAPAPRHLAHRDAAGQPCAPLAERSILLAGHHHERQAFALIALGCTAVGAGEHRGAELGVADQDVAVNFNANVRHHRTPMWTRRVEPFVVSSAEKRRA